MPSLLSEKIVRKKRHKIKAFYKFYTVKIDFQNQ